MNRAFQECHATQRDRVILFKGIFSSQMHLSVQKTFLMHQSELARVMLSFECFALWGR